jgi:hypothetical protein
VRIKYEDWKPGDAAMDVVRQANAICADYRQQGYDLTLRQLYYQFVARGFIPNNDKSYNRLGSIVNRGRMAGLIDWDYIVDRTRNLQSVGHWGSPASIISATARSFALDKWETQPTRVEVWVEKEALAGVVGQIADQLDCAWFSCRGYVSQSELWAAGQRLLSYIAKGQNVVVLHLGDHDPSGIDMTRDITDRLRNFTTQDWLNAHADDFEGTSVKVSQITASMRANCGGRGPLEVHRIALNMDQVQEYGPPPNPAKLTDSRVGSYLDEYGDESWELDALDPATLSALIEDEVLALRDEDLWADVVEEEERHTELLTLTSRRWADVVEMLEGAS